MKCSAQLNSKEIGTVIVDTSIELGSGATATIYRASFNGATYAAKIYNAEKRNNTSKVEAMLSNVPDNVSVQFAGITYPQLTWPIAILKSEQGIPIGFLMPLVDLEESYPLDYYYDQVLFKKLNAPDEVALSYKLEIAKNLASIVANLHKHGHYFIDLKPQNIRVFRRTHIVTLVDCDGYSVKSESGARFPAELISTDYIAPEVFRNQSDPKDLSESQDRYALAVILFQLLNQGTHPFQGIIHLEDGPNTNDEKAAAGLYPHGLIPNSNISPRPQSIHAFWLDTTRELFDKAFLGNPADRPSAMDWAAHFNQLLTEKVLVRCDNEPLNIAHMRFKGKNCPTCYLTDLKPFSTAQNKKNLSDQNNIKPPKVDKSNFELSPSWMILGFFIFIFILSILIDHKSNTTTSTTNDSNSTAPSLAVPSLEAGLAVDEGWRSMDPAKDNHNYQHAYEMNLKAHNLGHPEGASNIAMMYEHGWGVDKDIFQAIHWYEIALKNQNHSAQAEIGLARIYLDEFSNPQKAMEYIENAKQQLNHKTWAYQAEIFRPQIIALEQKMNLIASDTNTLAKEKKSELKSSKKEGTEETLKSKLSKLSKAEFDSVTSACSQSVFSGNKAYDLCLLNHLKMLNQQSTSLSLDTLSEEQKNQAEINCSEDKFTNGPAAYKKCLSAQIMQFKLN